MGRQLYQTQPVFRRSLEQCDEILQSYLAEKSLLEVIYPENPQELNNFFLDQTAYTQPALFAIEYALAQLWQSWGIKPDVVMGHSVGEYVAATVAGVFSLEDGLKLIAHRGRLMQKLPADGEMVAVMASEDKVNQLISPYKEKVALAAINGPESVVISGEAEAIKTIVNNLELQTIKSKRLQVSHAFHSPLMEPMLAEFDSVAKTISYQSSRIPIVSNLTGKIAGNEIATPSYWVRHISQPVQFRASMQTLQQQGYGIFVEIGAKPILLAMGQQCISDGDQLWLASLRSHQQDWYQLLESLAQLYVREIQIDWAGFERDYPKCRVLLPTYPFQRQRYWIENLSSDQLWRSHNHKSPHPPFEQKLQIVGKDCHFEEYNHTTSNQKQNWQLQNQIKKHPFLGYRLKDLASVANTYSWETEIDEQYLLNFKDYQIWDCVVMPQMAYIEIALAATEEAFGVKCKQLTNLQVHQPLFLSTKEQQKIQFILTFDSQNKIHFNAYSCQKNKQLLYQKWTLYATAQIHI